MYAAIHEASKEARIGHIDKTTDISELMTAESISTIILQMTTKLLAAVVSYGPISDYVKSGSWSSANRAVVLFDLISHFFRQRCLV
jgi:hypothetical protein